MSPAKARKPGEAAVGGDPLAPGFDGESGEIRVSHAASSNSTQIGEDRPMAWPGPQTDAVGRADHAFDELQSRSIEAGRSRILGFVAILTTALNTSSLT